MNKKRETKAIVVKNSKDGTISDNVVIGEFDTFLEAESTTGLKVHGNKMLKTSRSPESESKPTGRGRFFPGWRPKKK